MYTLGSLCEDVANKRGGVKGASDGVTAHDFSEVWTAMARYATACMEQKRGLHLQPLCKLGWLVEPARVGSNAAPKYRPHFQLTEQFCRSSAMTQAAAQKLCKPPAGELCPFEDFNFSKAAIKFSNQMTKDQVFSGTKALVQRLAEVVADGRDVQILFGDLGTLVCRGDREPHFTFAPEVYRQEGVEASTAASLDGTAANQKGRAAFSKHAPPEAQGMGVRGNTVTEATSGEEAGARTQEAPSRRAPTPMAYLPEDEPSPQRGSSGGRGLRSSGSAPCLTPSSVGGHNANLTNTQYKKEVAYKEAMDRHICAMEARASEAMQERSAYDEHVNGCLEQEREEIHGKRSRAQQNLHYLQHQMAMSEDKRRDQRREDVEAASAHEFPKFPDAEASEKTEFVRGQQARMKADLDDQVRTNNTLRNLAKQRERSLEVNQLKANREEMAMLRNAERAKKVYDREALATAWNSEIRMKNIWKAIDSHGKVGSKSEEGGSQPPQVLGMADQMLPPSTAGGRSTSTAGRLMTGNSRRAPVGASSSLSRLRQ